MSGKQRLATVGFLQFPSSHMTRLIPIGDMPYDNNTHCYVLCSHILQHTRSLAEVAVQSERHQAYG